MVYFQCEQHCPCGNRRLPMSNSIRPIVLGFAIMAALSTQLIAAPWWKKSTGDAGTQNQTASQADSNRSPAQTTYLDSLNHGREVLLAPREAAASNDVGVESVAAGQPDKSGPSSAFRIQCVASSQVESIRVAKKDLEGKISYPVSIVFAAPFYKLMVGSFDRRIDADSAVAKLRGLGYSDAWVVSPKVSNAK